MNQFLKDAGSNYFVYALQLLTGVLSIPIYLSVYGEILYGVYLLSFGLVSSLVFLQFGSSDSLLRFVAEYRTDQDDYKYALALKTSLLLTLISAFTIFGIFGIFGIFQNVIFTIPQEYSVISSHLFYLSGIYGFIFFIGKLPQAMVKGAGIFYTRNKFVILEIIVRLFFIWIVYYFEIGILWLLFLEMILLLITLSFDIIILAVKEKKLLRFDLVRNYRHVSIFDSEPWKYSKESFLLALISFFSQNADKLIIGLFLNVKMVTVYTIVTKPFNLFKSLLQKVFVILDPHYVKLKLKSHHELSHFIVECTMLLIISVSILISALIILLPDLFYLWLGTDEYSQYILYSWILLASLIIRSFYSLFNRALFVIGETKALIRVSIVTVGFNLTAGLICVYYFGFAGVIFGTCIQLILSTYMILSYSLKYFQSESTVVKSINKLLTLFYSGLVLMVIATYLLYKLRLSVDSFSYYTTSFSVYLFFVLLLLYMSRFRISNLLRKLKFT